ncbi:MAG: SUMF1/EgtB/PvdO family nonheme iron enzyme, partial [Deltaproteobacteria bacterium]|nr:SUMF1/EgtB/PvdO family nonheme iron enzyme [Deltaproteobacteria bacterium]
AGQFCQWLSMKTGRTYRLPTEKEWKALCARSGITGDNAREYAWFRKNAKFKTHEVGTLKADALGLHDLWGNASEWCVTEDGTGVTMGGAYKHPVDGIGCSMRAEPRPAWNASDPQFPKSIWWLADAGFVGMRIVCERIK